MRQFRWLIISVVVTGVMILGSSGCQYFTSKPDIKIRHVTDSVGFATRSAQMDSIIERIYRYQGDTLRHTLQKAGLTADGRWKTVISPHDDYSYVGYLYPAALANVKADTVLLFGVAHPAEEWRVGDQLIFGHYTHWSGPYDTVAVAHKLRDRMTAGLTNDQYSYNDSLMQVEHSLEALIPFLQYYNRDVTIIPVLVPYMKFSKMKSVAQALAEQFYNISTEKNWTWGKDYAIVISSDAVHYGNKGWNGKDFARFGTDSSGYREAVAHEKKIIRQGLVPRLHPMRLKRFNKFIVQDDNYKKYKWTWCGRYSVPFGLLTSYYMKKEQQGSLTGTLVGYATSIDHSPLPVQDIGMDTTAPSHLRHWVGYTVIGYR